MTAAEEHKSDFELKNGTPPLALTRELRGVFMSIWEKIDRIITVLSPWLCVCYGCIQVFAVCWYLCINTCILRRI